jgi:ribosomal protein L17
MSDNPKDKDFAPINVEVEDRIPMAGNRQSSTKASAVETKSKNGLTIVAFLVAAIACAASGYLYSLHTVQVNLLAENELRIQALEDKLSATGEEMGNSTVALQVKITELSATAKELWEQMDKLWASAWRRNQQEIKTLSANFKNLQQDTNKLVKDLDAKVASNNATSANIQSRVDGINTKVNAQANDLLSVNVRQDENLQTNSKQAATLREMSEKLILLEKRNTTLLQKIQQLENKITEVANKSV